MTREPGKGEEAGFPSAPPERARPTAGGRPRGLQEQRTRVPVVAESGRALRPQQETGTGAFTWALPEDAELFKAFAGFSRRTPGAWGARGFASSWCPLWPLWPGSAGPTTSDDCHGGLKLHFPNYKHS